MTLPTVSAKVLENLRHFDQLPDDAIVSPKIFAALIGISESKLRHSPPIPRVKISTQRGGFRVGTIRALVRGELAAATA